MPIPEQAFQARGENITTTYSCSSTFLRYRASLAIQ